MTDSSGSLIGRLRRLAERFRSSTLLTVVASLFLLDLAIPDALPFVDEIILGILTILIARWQARRTPPPKPPPKNVTPPS